jgi:hypothetical protein
MDLYTKQLPNGQTFTATALAGLGALSDPGVQSAAGDLMNALTSAGCTNGFDPTVQAFQNAYIEAGGNLPNDSDGSSGADGLYGANTQAALQAVLNAGVNQPPQGAPAGCVAPANGGGGGGTVPTVIPTQTVTGTVPSSNTKWILIGAGVLGVGVIGYALYRKNKRVRVVHLRKV